MGFFSNLFHKGTDASKAGKSMEDYMMLVRVYFQASLAEKLGINNLRMLPDLRTFKATLHVPTVNNKLGVGEKKACKNMLRNFFKLNDDFFEEIDRSIRKNCKKLQDVQPYLYSFQGFTQELLMLIGNLMNYKLRIPSWFKKTIYSMTSQTVNDIFMKNDYKDAGQMKSVLAIRQYDKRLGFSQKWITDFAYHTVMLAKKQPRQATEDDNQKNKQ